MSNFNFQTIQDVKSRMYGFQDWVFGGKASFNDFCDYVLSNYDNIKYDCFDGNDEAFESNVDRQVDQLMADYLLSVGENPGDYLEHYVAEDQKKCLRLEREKEKLK
jgi:hypothetical protein